MQLTLQSIEQQLYTIADRLTPLMRIAEALEEDLEQDRSESRRTKYVQHDERLAERGYCACFSCVEWSRRRR